jgi:hypothetical protein
MSFEGRQVDSIIFEGLSTEESVRVSFARAHVLEN